MNIYINGDRITLDNSSSLTTALAIYQRQNSALNNFALAVNGDFISRADYPSTVLNDNDSIDIFAPIQGG